MSDPNSPSNPPLDEPVRPHTYDGIQEYDKRLPNWWLFTLYGAIAFSFVYWLYYHASQVGMSDHQRLAREMQAIEAARLANSMGALNDDQLWALSRNPQITEAGRAIFNTNCTACHLKSLRGKDENPTAVGPSLVDASWIYGERPTQMQEIIRKGTPNGMLPWGPQLGDRKIVEVLAYVLSHHTAPAAAESAATTAPAATGGASSPSVQ